MSPKYSNGGDNKEQHQTPLLRTDPSEEGSTPLHFNHCEKGKTPSSKADSSSGSASGAGPHRRVRVRILNDDQPYETQRLPPTEQMKTTNQFPDCPSPTESEKSAGLSTLADIYASKQAKNVYAPKEEAFQFVDPRIGVSSAFHHAPMVAPGLPRYGQPLPPPPQDAPAWYGGYAPEQPQRHLYHHRPESYAMYSPYHHHQVYNGYQGYHQYHQYHPGYHPAAYNYHNYYGHAQQYNGGTYDDDYEPLLDHRGRVIDLADGDNSVTSTITNCYPPGTPHAFLKRETNDDQTEEEEKHVPPMNLQPLCPPPSKEIVPPSETRSVGAIEMMGQIVDILTPLCGASTARTARSLGALQPWHSVTSMHQHLGLYRNGVRAGRISSKVKHCTKSSLRGSFN